MPTYSYRCTQCSTAFDVQQAFTDDSLTECPSCQGHLRKIFSAVGVTFNGSGFYRTDSRAAAAGGKSQSGEKSDSGGSGSPTPASTPSTTSSSNSNSSNANTTKSAAPAAS